MDEVGLYLSGAGSLDGSDIFTSVLAFQQLQDMDYRPVPVGRDVPQGEVRNHRFAHEESTQRNALDEAARIVRGDISDMRDVHVDSFAALVLVGGGGTLSTWTDYVERGASCRITERLRFHLRDCHGAGIPVLALDNAVFAVAHALSEPAEELVVNPGSDRSLRRAIEERGVRCVSEDPCWDSSNRVGSLPDLLAEDDLVVLQSRIGGLFRRAL